MHSNNSLLRNHSSKGNDVNFTHIFFPKVSFPYKECDATNRLDVLLLHELKETFCHLSEVCWEAVVISQLFSLQTSRGS